MKSEQPNQGRALALTGAFLQLGPIIGVAGTVVGMLRAFGTLGSGSEAADPQQLSANIGTVLVSTVIGLGLGLIGLVLIGVALFASRYRSAWLFWFLVAYGGLLLCGIPVGTVVGLVVLAYCLVNRAEFLRRKEPVQHAP